MAYNTDSLTHKAGRKAVEVAIDAALKYTNKDRQKALNQFIDLGQKFLGNTWPEKAWENLHAQVNNPDSKWMQYVNDFFNDIAPKQIKMAALNLGYEVGFTGYKYTQELSKKYSCNIPWVVLFDPTSACNLRCTGCWAAEYGHTKSLTYEEIEGIVKQGRDLGIHGYVMTGGEPMTRKKDLIRLADEFQDCAFMFFTNGTLIDDEFCKEMVRVGNLVPSVSIEGFKEANDSRRGEGTYERILHAFDLMKENHCLFGTSICYTSRNYKDVTADDFLDMLIAHGVKFSWYFHYMPVGNAASTDLLLNPEQREYMYHRVREIRGYEGGKKLMTIDFQNDGEYVHGCIAGGKAYCHINPNGDVEPCVFIHYSGANIKEKSLLECFQQPLFKAYHQQQPFNQNFLQPCPMLENPQKLQAMVRAAGAKSTDMEAPESVEHLCGKCANYAKEWTPTAQRLWASNHPGYKPEQTGTDAQA